MTEIEKIEYAKSCIDKLANGINPIDGTAIPENDIVNNVRLSRCFFYVSDVLRQVIENGGVQPISADRIKKTEFHLTDEEKASLKTSDTPIYVSDIAKYLNTVIDVNRTKKISPYAINTWLLLNGILEEVYVENGRIKKLPSKLGNELGIFAEERSGQYGTYHVVLFSPEAQQYVYDNLEAIVNCKSKKRNSAIEHQGQRWTPELDNTLTEMFGNGVSVAEIATVLGRTQNGIVTRLMKLGLIEKNE